ncbi:hypothetical protein EPH_0047670 [Eimeria praecox]|uniref:Uncharacterized protein n=1 Tax=Eimeria praecox TaxID=51316 RepID=U6GG28_9EIME|nr:hypothetical protein EPH_0047670 [Eimeria praecox]
MNVLGMQQDVMLTLSVQTALDHSDANISLLVANSLTGLPALALTTTYLIVEQRDSVKSDVKMQKKSENALIRKKAKKVLAVLAKRQAKQAKQARQAKPAARQARQEKQARPAARQVKQEKQARQAARQARQAKQARPAARQAKPKKEVKKERKKRMVVLP